MARKYLLNMIIVGFGMLVSSSNVMAEELRPACYNESAGVKYNHYFEGVRCTSKHGCECKSKVCPPLHTLTIICEPK